MLREKIAYACGVGSAGIVAIVGGDVFDAELGAVTLYFVVWQGVVCVDAYPHGVGGCVCDGVCVASYDVDGVALYYIEAGKTDRLPVVTKYGVSSVNAVYGCAPTLGALLIE